MTTLVTAKIEAVYERLERADVDTLVVHVGLID